MNKLRIVGLCLLGLLSAAGLFISSTYLFNQIKLKQEVKQIQQYGRKIPMFDGEINIVDQGTGKNTIILLPGYGTASPYLDFKKLADSLSMEHRVIVIEPFGYGLSSQTARPRTKENIVEEFQKVIRTLDLKSYSLMGHSIAGLYAVNYVNQYPDEPVKAFIGIDSSVPEQPMEKPNLGFYNFLKTSGLMRLMIAASPEKTLGTADNVRQLSMITFKNLTSKSIENELQHLFENFATSKNLTFPKELPVMLFVADNDDSMPHWKEMHQKQAAHSINGQMHFLKGPHYLHREQAEKISQETSSFLKQVKPGY
ncbi:alpha/beta fold hydrolase [Vagococcus vulneris]|uniref:AB hydrolase-1 domain-containing protein n=1 Tax=Vagococcus vulneris TaxID=1977869 RepID=A0A429ZQ72_9ENTE|nr:alpha/beta hydrolase [Vagococcus vulneris]RST95808.1 hypothetical protein CBF37_11350 [Vagococcus vulneris]